MYIHPTGRSLRECGPWRLPWNREATERDESAECFGEQRR